MCVDGRYSTCNSGLLLRYMSRVCRVYIVVVVVVYSEKYIKEKKGKGSLWWCWPQDPRFFFLSVSCCVKKTLGHPPQKPERKLNKSKLYYYYRKKKTPLRGTCTRESLVCWTFAAADAGQGEKNKIKIYTQQQKSFKKKKKKKKKGKPHLLIRRTFPLELFFSSSSYSSTQPKNIISFRKKKKNI